MTGGSLHLDSDTHRPYSNETIVGLCIGAKSCQMVVTGERYVFYFGIYLYVVVLTGARE